MPCHVDVAPKLIPFRREEWLEYMLCQAFRNLSAEQIDAIGKSYRYDGVYGYPRSWYKEHLIMDCVAEGFLNEHIQELKKLGIDAALDENGNFILKNEQGRIIESFDKERIEAIRNRLKKSRWQ